MKNYKDMYPENMIIKQAHEIEDKVRILKNSFNVRKIRAEMIYDTDGVVIVVKRKDGYQALFYYKNPILICHIFSSILFYISEHGGIEQWQIPKN